MKMREFCIKHSIGFAIALGLFYIMVGSLIHYLITSVFPVNGWIFFEAFFWVGFVLLMIFVKRYARINTKD
jgi:hypothetical protein